ncbi:MAG: prepilin-type N-terminal cleavage/methylation domain-containing protein [Halomonas sp.]|uniref:PilW family protein n=1 Tax=Halomonas sp. TaxID=1486246 RepID=UPI0028703946|nr:prepilin-type N-terminal cleavage/methylation domain-containing protein [Halomonas sp.]MDR9439817.1 prepilin-type N-terminal cleavage/methylation domain-containing protein [Halomonas sp.]
MKHNAGFSLVELMIAMVIGLIIMLGAGQLFLTVFQTNRQVETLGEKQAAVNFAVETLLRDIRRADWDSDDTAWDEDAAVLSLDVKNQGDVSSGCDPGENVVKNYKLSSSGVFSVEMDKCDGVDLGGGYQELVSGFLAPDEVTPGPGFEVDDNEWNNGLLEVIFRLVPTDEDATPDTLVFHAVNRTTAVNK